MAAAAAGAGGQTLGRSSFSRAASPQVASSSNADGVKLGSNGAAFVSSGIPDLDRILGGGFLLGSAVMVVEDSDAPHHLLLRSFMAHCVVHKQPLLFAGPMKEPRLFLFTLPAPVASSKEDRQQRAMGAGASSDGRASDEGLRIAWQYKKYFGEEKTSHAENRDSKQEFSNDFDFQKPWERHLLNAQHIECVTTQDADSLTNLQDCCSTFSSKLPRKDVGNLNAGRIAIVTLCTAVSIL